MWSRRAVACARTPRKPCLPSTSPNKSPTTTSSLRPTLSTFCLPQDYNVRNFILRRAKEDFAKHRGLSGEAAAQALAKVRQESKAATGGVRLVCAATSLVSTPYSLHAPSSLFRLQGESDLELIKRQSIIAGFYKTQASVMEAYEARKAGSK